MSLKWSGGETPENTDTQQNFSKRLSLFVSAITTLVIKTNPEKGQSTPHEENDLPNQNSNSLY